MSQDDQPNEATQALEPQVGDPAAFDPHAEAKRLLRATRAGTLATLDGPGGPFASLVTLATDPAGAPLLLLSRLASHTRHLENDARLSLLLAALGQGDPLAHPRVTITGEAHRIETPAARLAARARFLAKHPKAALYADFGDFSFWRVEMDQIHLNGGFARAARFPAVRLLVPVEDAEALIAAEAEALAHMNTDHAEALALYARSFGGATGEDWRATGLDPEGLDLAQGDATLRIPFPRRVTTPADLRAVLIEMVQLARKSA